MKITSVMSCGGLNPPYHITSGFSKGSGTVCLCVCVSVCLCVKEQVCVQLASLKVCEVLPTELCKVLSKIVPVLVM